MNWVPLIKEWENINLSICNRLLIQACIFLSIKGLCYIEQCRKEITVNLFPDPDNVQHPRVAQLRDDEVVVIELGGLVMVWLQATDIPVEKKKVMQSI